MCKKLVALTLCVFAVSVVGNPVVHAGDPTLVGWWKLDEGTGTTARDISGYGNDGTFGGDPQWVAGRFGKALEFDGSDDFLDCGNDPRLDLTLWTIAFWLNAAQNKDYNGFVIKGLDAAIGVFATCSDRCLVMGHGHIVFKGTPDELRANSAIRKEWLEV